MTETLSTEDGRPTLRIERRLRHAPDKVWRAITEPEHLSKWYPFRAVTMDLRLGGAIHFEGGGVTMHAVITELDPPRTFAFSERAPEMMTRESEDLVHFELRPDGDGCLLVFSHTFDDRPAAASYASGWMMCLDAMESVLADQPVEMTPPSPRLHEHYVRAFGLDQGTVEQTADGWLVRFERQLTKPVDVVREQIREHATDNVIFELSQGTGHGARLVLTQTGTGDSSAALTSWRAWLNDLARPDL